MFLTLLLFIKFSLKILVFGTIVIENYDYGSIHRVILKVYSIRIVDCSFPKRMVFVSCCHEQ